MSRLSTATFFFFNAPATTEIYTLSLHDALPILRLTCEWITLYLALVPDELVGDVIFAEIKVAGPALDRKSTRLNSSHSQISYAVFCLKKKKKKISTYNDHRD